MCVAKTVTLRRVGREAGPGVQGAVAPHLNPAKLWCRAIMSCLLSPWVARAMVWDDHGLRGWHRASSP
jgi:hypothetical protein